MQFKDKVIWISGASSGIGEALVQEWAKLGAQLILSSRREAELERVKASCGAYKDQCYVLPMDLTQADSLPQKATEVLEKFGKVDILVNNGGMSQRGYVHETDLVVDRKIFEVNYFGHIILTKALLPSMLKNGGGQIVVISSVVGKFGFSLRSAYAASKHALHGFFESLDIELRPKNIRVTMVCPGRIRTNISVNALTKDGTAHGKMDEGQAQGVPADVCARKIIRGVRKGKREIYIGKEQVLIYFRRFIPPLFFTIAAKVSPT